MAMKYLILFILMSAIVWGTCVVPTEDMTVTSSANNTLCRVTL